MGKIKLLDCTLRDGGYVNDWKFGHKAIKDIKENLELSGVDIIELGFIKNELENKDRTVFNNMDAVKKLIGQKLQNREYAVMAEVVNPLPLDMLAPYDDESPEIIRVIVWKRMLKEGFEYCKGIVEKGYKLCVQPARVSQYSDEEFVDMIKMFNELNPMAIYVVDSWGTMYKEELLHYLKLADENLKDGISVGYHGHNNMMQAFDVACAFCEQPLKRDLIIDASVYGIGRGAGNLNTEIFAKYANTYLDKSYDLKPLVKIYDKYISNIYKKEKWGYSVPYFISAKYNCNPNFASYYEKKGVSNELIEIAISAMKPDERIIFKKEIADKYYNNFCKIKKINTLRNILKTKYNDKKPRTNIKDISSKYDYELKRDNFELTKNVKSNLLYGSQDNVANPFVTVFIPTYKRLDLFKEALESVLNQMPVDFEWNIIIVDNEPYRGEANDTQKYIESLNLSKIAYYRNDENLRPGDNFNRGIYLAKAPWVMMLHDDDLLASNALKRMGTAIKFLTSVKGKKLGAISASGFQFKYDPQKPREHKYLLDAVNALAIKRESIYNFYKLTHWNVLCTGHIGGSVPSNGTIFNRDAVLNVGGFNEEAGISADLILYYCLERDYSVYALNEIIGFYRWGINQMSKRENAYNTIKDNLDFREYVFQKNIFTKFFGFLFRDALYYSFTKCVLGMRKIVTYDSVEYSDYADIYNNKPNYFTYVFWKMIIHNIYSVIMNAEKCVLTYKAAKFLKEEKMEQK